MHRCSLPSRFILCCGVTLLLCHATLLTIEVTDWPDFGHYGVIPIVLIGYADRHTFCLRICTISFLVAAETERQESPAFRTNLGPKRKVNWDAFHPCVPGDWLLHQPQRLPHSVLELSQFFRCWYLPQPGSPICDMLWLPCDDSIPKRHQQTGLAPGFYMSSRLQHQRSHGPNVADIPESNTFTISWFEMCSSL